MKSSNVCIITRSPLAFLLFQINQAWNCKMNYYTTTEISGIQTNVIIKFVVQRTKMHIEHGFLKKKLKKKKKKATIFTSPLLKLTTILNNLFEVFSHEIMKSSLVKRSQSVGKYHRGINYFIVNYLRREKPYAMTKYH